MRRHPLSSLLFALALLLGQWLTLAHGFEHPALADDTACDIGLHTQQLGGALGVVTALRLAAPPTEALRATSSAGLPRSGSAAAYLSRGPPHLA